MNELVRYDAARKAIGEARRVDEAKSIRDKAEAARAYARQAKDRQMEIDAVEIRDRAETRLGELLRAQKVLSREDGGGLNRGGGPRKRTGTERVPVLLDTAPKLEELGIDKKLSARAQKKAELKERDPKEYERRIEAWRNDEQSKIAVRVSPIDIHFSSDKNDWGTPSGLFAELDKRFAFTLDVCASEWNAKCNKFYDESMNGLIKEWKGSCWMNPPYGDEIGKWMEKAYTESRNGDCKVVCLVPARVDTAWWWDYAVKGSVEHIRGRLKFLRPTGEADAAPFPSAVVIFNRKRKRYVQYGETVFVLET